MRSLQPRAMPRSGAVVFSLLQPGVVVTSGVTNSCLSLPGARRPAWRLDELRDLGDHRHNDQLRHLRQFPAVCRAVGWGVSLVEGMVQSAPAP
jgi:hypothetical protein